MNLYEALERNFDELPSEVKLAYAKEKGLCDGYCDADGGIDASCVWDSNKPYDCCHAEVGVKKHDCKHWIKIEATSS